MEINPPSLNELQEFLLSNRDHFDEDEHKGVAGYLSDTNEKYSNGKYWLNGQLEMTPDEKITIEKINNAIEIDNRRKIEYGGPCNALEAMSMLHHEKKFENLQNVLHKYYELLQEEYFRPPKPCDPTDTGGLFYQKLAENTLIGK